MKMLIKVGCEIEFTFPNPTAIVLMLNLHPSAAVRVRGLEVLRVYPHVPITHYTDSYGNCCGRVFVPAGHIKITHDAVVIDHGQPDPQVWNVHQLPVQNLPDDVLLFLLASRYCEVDSVLKEIAWSLFGHFPAGWPLVQAICNFVNGHIRFDYQQARANRTAIEVFRERTGVCRDFMHLAITFCRCLNVPARYCTGYLGDIRVPAVPQPMDFSAWFEVFLGGKWYAFDARNNTPRIGRILMARGRDAADVAMTTTFGVNQLQSFKVWADEVPEGASIVQMDERVKMDAQS
jgi:transglutaminase-like putative cysteine protease